MLLYTNIDQTLVNSLQRLLNCKKGELDCHAITTEYETRAHCLYKLTSLFTIQLDITYTKLQTCTINKHTYQDQYRIKYLRKL